jgi:hypothetical protein
LGVAVQGPTAARPDSKVTTCFTKARRVGFQQRANAVRSIPLADVLAKWGADRDRLDRNRWYTERGPVSITGSKFFNWHLQQGGGGAIDLAMHLGDCNASVAVGWLEQYLGDSGSGSFLFSPADLGRDRSSPISRRSFSDTVNVRVRSLCLPVAHPGNFIATVDSRFEMEIGGETPGIEHDWMNISGTTKLDGDLKVSLIDAAGGEFEPIRGDHFDIIQAAGDITGRF